MRTMITCTTSLLIACGLGAAAGPQPEQRPGPERDPAELHALLDRARDQGLDRVRIPPGTYRLPARTDGQAHLLFRGVEDLEIEAAGVELVMTEVRRAPLVAFYDCARVTVRGLTVDCDPVVFTQGRVQGMDPDRAWYEVRIDPGYEARVEQLPNPRPMSVFDRTPERTWKRGVPDIFIERLEQAGPDLIRVIPAPHCRWACPIEAGDPVAIPLFSQPGITCRGSVDIVFEDCTIHQSGSMAFHEHGGGGNTTLRRCRVLRRPGTDRLLSTNADGFHCKNMRRGPTVEDCTFERMHDDGINIHAMYARVIEVPSPTTVIVTPAYEPTTRAGDRVEFFQARTGQSLGVFHIEAVKQLPRLDPDAMARFGSHAGIQVELTVAGHPPVAAMDAMICLDACGAEFTIRRNRFGPIRYRGILIRSHAGVIEENRLTACGNDAITLSTDLWSEGPYPEGIVVRGNTILDTGRMPYGQAGTAIHVGISDHGRQAPDLDVFGPEHIVIEHNRVDETVRHGISVSRARNVLIRGNDLSRIGVHPIPGGDGVPVRIEHSDRVEQGE
jgi:hypothetical protein